jgi:hypothetical protein
MLDEPFKEELGNAEDSEQLYELLKDKEAA